jgi:uncharacterized protein YkwD
MNLPKSKFVMYSRFFAAALAFLLCAGGLRAGTGQEISGDAVRILKQKLVDRINADRQQAKLPPLLYFDEISRLADAHCKEMLESNFVSHWNRAGQKSYIRYSLGGIIDHAAERAGRILDSKFNLTLDNLEAQLLKIHENFMLGQAGAAQARWTMLEPHHTHAGIGVAFSQTQVIMIEVFASRYVTMTKPAPARTTLSEKLRIEGKLSVKGYEVKGVSIYYEPFPVEKSIAELKAAGSTGGGEGFPKDVLLQRAILPPMSFYDDGTRGTLETDGTKFNANIPFFREQPGVYTIVVWVKDSRYNEPFFMGTTMCVFVEADKTAKTTSQNAGDSRCP